MKLKKSASIRITVHSCCIVALTLLFCHFIQYDLANLPNFGAVQDMDITDFYNSVADARDVAELDTNIVIVDVGLANRAQIADALQTIDLCEPAAIGLDIIFRELTDTFVDAKLTETILSIPNLVVANDIERKGNSFYDDFIPENNKGFANLGGQFDVIRKYHTFLKTNNGTANSFAFQLVIQSQKPHNKFDNIEHHYIIYPSRGFYEISISEIEENADLLKGKIVLLGTLADNEDTHITPIDQRMNGVKIHAYTIATILSDKQITTANVTLQWAIAIIVVFLLIFIRVHFMFSQNSAGDILIRILQLFTVWIFVYASYKLFICWYIYCDISIALLTCISLLVADVWQAGIVVYDKIASKIKAVCKKH